MAITQELKEVVVTAEVAEVPTLYYMTVHNKDRVFTAPMVLKARNAEADTLNFTETTINKDGEPYSYTRTLSVAQLTRDDVVLGTNGYSLYRGVYESLEAAQLAAKNHKDNS